MAVGDPGMLAAEFVLDGDDVIGGQELLLGDKAAPADLYQGGGCVADVAVPVALPPNRHDRDLAGVRLVAVDPQGGPVGLAAAASQVREQREPVGEQPAQPPSVEPVDEAARAGDEPRPPP